MAEPLIKDLPDRLCWHIAFILDKTSKPNWKTLISKIQNNPYDSKTINKFYMEVLSPHGSPSMKLLEDLGRKNKTVSQLVTWLECFVEWNELVSLLNRAKKKEIYPLILRQFPEESVFLGNEVTLSVEASGELPLYFQWFKGKKKLDGETKSVLQISPICSEIVGNYICRVWNQFGFVFSKWIKVCDGVHLSNLPTITTHPRSSSFENGGTLRLYSDAVGNPPPMFQWFFNGKCLIGQCGRDLVIEQATIDNEGLYQMQASNKYGTVTSLSSNVVCLKSSNNSLLEGRGVPSLDSIDKKVVPSNLPSQKVALLIGNGEYYQEEKLGKLVHPINDVHEIAETLRIIGFKVVSLVNLDFFAMKRAIDFFYDQLDSGTYGLFYFAGHGFEVNNEVYLMPVNATENFSVDENIPISRILRTLAIKHAKLSVLLIDCCRSKPEYNQPCISNPLPKLLDTTSDSMLPHTIQDKNVIIGFGCCSQSRVMESPVMNNSFYAKYLIEYIVKPIKVDDMLYEVARCIDLSNIIDPSSGKKQVMYRHSTVVEEMKLTDEVLLSTFQTRLSNLWELAHIAPESPITILQNNSITIKLSFAAEFSNVLLIHSVVENHNKNEYCDVKFILPHKIGGAPVEIARICNSGGFLEFVRISNLERLEGDISIHLNVTYESFGVTKQYLTSYSIKEKPLYAKVASTTEG
ncbi:mucosa-associated lymphoid tissue lymphoma translocation protein 1 isoform X2 [Hydra vulgaris]|uniref:Mucosa-associated lymphoid tissue lymphoma translocation protein 1 isoform X2 n=1 Tax=Hydra vulgaris TaxID=6087 RepID=A0ABM4C404_HYDVU